jgi:hypothetical protein
MSIALWWADAGVSVLLVVGFGIYTLAVWWTSAGWKNYAWRKTITDHLGEITKAEINKRDEQIARLSMTLDQEQRQVEQLRVKVRTMAALAAKQTETAGETARGYAEKDGE